MFFDDAFTLFLQSIGRTEEIDFYLKKFRQDSSRYFALIVPDVESLREAPELLRTHLNFLSRLGLFPAVLITEPFAEECVTVFSSERLFRIHDLERDKLTSGMPESGSGRKISVLRSGQGLPSALEGLVPSMTRRIQFVRLAGAIRSSEKEPLFHCHPEASVWSEDRALLELGQGLLKKEAGLHLSVTTPFDLLKEIFTVKGAGTIIRNRSEILVYHSAAQVDRMRLMGLLEESFGRKLRDPDFFSSVIEYHIDSDYRGAILLEDYRGMRYLSKFAVGIQARGEGVAQELWESVLSAGGPLFWRSRRKNTIHRWYERLADGFHRLDQWTVYWKDVPLASVPEIVTYAMERPEDFSDFSLPPVPSDQTGP